MTTRCEDNIGQLGIKLLQSKQGAITTWKVLWPWILSAPEDYLTHRIHQKSETLAESYKWYCKREYSVVS